MTASDERRELERAVELLGRSTRHGRLLAYLGEKYFDHQEAQLTEFNLATEFFARPAERFDAGQDAVVRVEVHRLRKKLRDIYEKDAGPNGMRISLPAGSYVPQFSRATEPPAVIEPAPIADVATSPSSASPEALESSPSPSSRGKKISYLAIALAVVLAAGLGAWQIKTNKETGSRVATTAATPSAASDHAALTEVRLMAGYTGSDIIGGSGERWTSDRFYSGGGVVPATGRTARRTSRPFLYGNWRVGEFAYNIPLKKGAYEMRLFFLSAARVGEERLADFNVFLNGEPLLTSYDSYASTQSVNYADEIVFKDISPDNDGILKLWFLSAIDTPMLNALEIVPGTAGMLKPIRIVTQPMSFVDHKGQRWRADDYFMGGISSGEVHRVSGTEDPELFGAERYGHFSYAIPVDKRGSYTVVLHFAELYFGPQLPGGGGEGSRIFHVYCNGKTLLENFDVYREAGSKRVIARTFRNVRPSAQGKINLTFEPVINNATVSGIEIFDESGLGPRRSGTWGGHCG
jgi:hypothetical protein